MSVCRGLVAFGIFVTRAIPSINTMHPGTILWTVLRVIGTAHQCFSFQCLFKSGYFNGTLGQVKGRTMLKFSHHGNHAYLSLPVNRQSFSKVPS